MAQTRMRVSCAGDTPHCLQIMPSVNLIYTDVWTDPALATPGTPINLRYDDATQFMTAFPTSATCVTVVVVHLPHHPQLQPADSAAVGPVAPTLDP